MGNYSVKSGDNLWNIVKREFKLTSNSDVLKKVKEIAKANNLDKPEEIFVGQEINLGNTMDAVELSTKKESGNMGIEKTNATNPYLESAKTAAKQRIANGDIKTYEDLNTLGTSSVSLWGDQVLTKEQKNLMLENILKKKNKTNTLSFAHLVSCSVFINNLKYIIQINNHKTFMFTIYFLPIKSNLLYLGSYLV